MHKTLSIADYVRENISSPIIKINIENGSFKISNDLLINQISIGEENTTSSISGEKKKISNDLVTDFEDYTLLIEKLKSSLNAYLDNISQYRPSFIKITKINDDRYKISLDHFQTKYNDIERIINITKKNEKSCFRRENNKAPTTEEIRNTVQTQKTLKNIYNSATKLYTTFENSKHLHLL